MGAEGESPGYGRWLAAAAAAAWALMLGGVLVHRVFVTNDSLSNYAHVWFVSDSLWSGGGIPYHFSAIGHGDALAYPYAFLPWTTAALVRPVLGDWATTLWLATGAALLITATFWTLPETRRPLPAAAVLLNPVLVEGLVLGQLPFLWAAALLLAAAGCWRRGWRVAAVVLAGAAQGSHPAVLLPITGLLAAFWFIAGERRRRALALAYAASLVLALPGVAMVLLAPAIEDSGLRAALANLAGTAGLRAAVVAVPAAVAWLAAQGRRRALTVLALAALALNLLLVPLRDTAYAWQAFFRSPDTSFEAYLDSTAFEPGATYRLLRVADGKVGMYQLIRAGGRLDSEFFPESINRRSWPDARAYASFLAGRHVDLVVIYSTYDARYQTNEHDLLRALEREGCATRTAYDGDGFDVFRLAPACLTRPRG